MWKLTKRCLECGRETHSRMIECVCGGKSFFIIDEQEKGNTHNEDNGTKNGKLHEDQTCGSKS